MYMYVLDLSFSWHLRAWLLDIQFECRNQGKSTSQSESKPSIEPIQVWMIVLGSGVDWHYDFGF